MAPVVRRFVAALAALAVNTLAWDASSQTQHERVTDDLTTLPAIEVAPTLDLPYPQIIDPLRAVPGTLSLGTTSSGRLARAAQLPTEGEGFYILQEHRTRDTHWGTEELIALLVESGARYHEMTGARFGVGNISVRSGGRISWSRSHNAGRDADVAFPFLDADGAAVEPTTLIRVRRDGRARGSADLRFDAERAWLMVESWLTSEIAQVQWIFIYAPLKRQLLEHAASIGAAPELIAIADEVLHQPGDSAPHDDHFHIRIYCSRADVLEGCANWGPRRAHADYHEEDLLVRIGELARGTSDPNPETATTCLERVDALAGKGAAFAIAEMLPEMAPEIQVRAMELLARYDVHGVAGPMVALLESSADDEVRQQAAWVLGRLADPSSSVPLAKLVERDGEPLADGTSLRFAAAHALRNVFEPDAVPSLIAAIDEPRHEVRAAVVHTLTRITGRTSTLDVGAELSDSERADLRDEWTAWYDAHRDLPQSVWWAAALREAGYPATTFDDTPLAVLVDALLHTNDAIRFIADRWLMARTGAWTPSEAWTTERRHRFWVERVGRR